MANTYSPLRYPGGKSSIAWNIREIINASGLNLCTYAEPFAGGCGLALKLLFDGVVSSIQINDLDLTVWSFWKAVLDHTDDLCRLVHDTPISVDQWKHQRTQLAKGAGIDSVALGFATFFLNRTNRSGIIKGGGIIGGVLQNGTYKIDCRYNRTALVRRIERIAKHRGSITLSNLDAIDFIDRFEAEAKKYSLLCIDPPYFNKGSSLYTNFYRKSDHAILAKRVLDIKSPWLMTYDDSTEIRTLYKDCPAYRFSINYSAQRKRTGTELLIHSPSVVVPGHVSTAMEAA
jgi:DNA adenine methylase